MNKSPTAYAARENTMRSGNTFRACPANVHVLHNDENTQNILPAVCPQPAREDMYREKTQKKKNGVMSVQCLHHFLHFGLVTPSDDVEDVWTNYDVVPGKFSGLPKTTDTFRGNGVSSQQDNNEEI
ncbi:hypothetical protein VTJ04DRAFT_874 [Mycothermus thermophilus]|uniref:uncharacterized protein n=1 Tax=Humicola insolens TaxID=85995 RepID=UPI003742E58F